MDHAALPALPSPLGRLRHHALVALGRGRPAVLLLARLALGILFVSTGWGKVHDLAKVTAFFVELHIPAPGWSAVVVAYSELLCGAALVIGLLTRLATVPLIVSMFVAILTARLGDIHGLASLTQVDEFTYLVLLLVIAFVGPGKLSIDTLLVRSSRHPRSSATRAGGPRP